MSISRRFISSFKQVSIVINLFTFHKYFYVTRVLLRGKFLLFIRISSTEVFNSPSFSVS